MALGRSGDSMNLTVRVEDIMTPRRQLRHAASNAEAAKAAEKEDFDAIPLTRPDGLVREFWSRADERRIRIRQEYRISYDAPVERLLPPLGSHVIQFVYYRSEMVGLIDASDLNKPIARIVWLHPMLELERSILDAVRARGITDDEQATALGKQAGSTRGRQAKARRHDLALPLLEYAQFPDLLRAAHRLGITQLADEEIDELNRVRKRAAHSGDAVVEDRNDCARIRRALEMARKATRDVEGHSPARGL